jgi:putative two-component system response regulator
VGGGDASGIGALKAKPLRTTTREDMAPAPDAASSAQRIVVVEDADGAALLERMLHAAGYENVRTATAPAVLDVLLDRWDPDLVVLDLQLPSIDGFALLQRIVSIDVPCLVLTADDSATTRRRALGLGARDFVTKPLDRVEVLLRVGNLLQTRRLQRALEDRNHDLQRWVRARTADLEDARRETLERLALAAEYRDDDTQLHTKRVGRTAALLATRLGLSPDTVEHLRLAAPLHDVGKIGIPDAVWLKPGKLTDHERKMLEQHTEIGARILSGSRSPILRLAEQIARAHHERFDGSGYPHGLAGDGIPLAGRITAVADVFDVLAHPRPHKQAWPLEKAVEEIHDQAGRHFDPEVVAAFRRLDPRALLDPVAEQIRHAA